MIFTEAFSWKVLLVMMCLDSMIFLDGGITCKNRRGTPILAKFAETSFRQITNLAFCCGRKQGLREMLAATFLGPACLPQRHFSSLLDRKKRFFRGCFGFVSEGASFPGWTKRLQFHQGCFVFFTGGSGWQMNEMMQKASAFWRHGAEWLVLSFWKFAWVSEKD